MAAKAAKEAEKIAKVTTKKLGAARLKEFEQDAMVREDMLDGTFCPVTLTPLVGRTVVPGSDLGIGSSIVESDVDTNEMNPEKMMYQPGTTTEDDTSSLSAIPTSPLKRTYTEVVSPKAKKVATVEIDFSGPNHYTSAGIVVRTTKINFNIKEAKATPFTPVLL